MLHPDIAAVLAGEKEGCINKYFILDVPQPINYNTMLLKTRRTKWQHGNVKNVVYISSEVDLEIALFGFVLLGVIKNTESEPATTKKACFIKGRCLGTKA